jgi:HTH-type transcriptional regulator/antitoxin HigA
MITEPPLSPGEYVKKELQQRAWTQTDLAEILGRHLPAVSEIVLAKRTVTPEMAVALGTAFGNGPEIWLQRENAYRLSLFEQQDDPEVGRRARLFDMAPVKDMEKRGWIKPTETLAELEQELCRFFKVSSIDQEPAFDAVARKSAPDKTLSPAQRAWCMRGARMASTLSVSPFSASKFSKEFPELRTLAAYPEQAREVPKVLASLGVRMVVIEPLQRSRIDGAAFWLDDQSPVIVLSVRFDRIDGFWHTLAHELSHILHHDVASIDTDMVGENKERNQTADIETRAEKEASEFLIPPALLQSFILRVKPLYSKSRIIQFANRVKIHPGIVAGQLQHLQEISYAANREMLVRVRDLLASAALTDGWGHTVPAI